MRINIYVDARFKAPKDSQYIILATFEAQSIEHLIIEHLSKTYRTYTEHLSNIYGMVGNFGAPLGDFGVSLGSLWGLICVIRAILEAYVSHFEKLTMAHVCRERSICPILVRKKNSKDAE